MVKSANHKGQFLADLKLSKNDTRLVGIIGRLTQIKNHRLFLEAVQLLTNSKGDNKTRFLIVGNGELRRYLEDLTHQLRLADRVVFTGWLKDLTSLYADLDVLALTSDNEGTPVAMIEAMAAGVPVVATDVGGVKGLISDFGIRIGECRMRPPATRLPSPATAVRLDAGVRGNGGQVAWSPSASAEPRDAGHGEGDWRAGSADCAPVKKASRFTGQGVRNVANAELKEGEFEICERGVLVKPGDVEGFAKGLQYLLEHPDVRREMGQRGREYALKHHSKDRLIADMDRLYRSLLL
ncbi:unnamed protein product [marine sediment metagenome]|uniref:Uncharacterized protein n=1 Tax=marine sediment metagenome TaxID=412755 RepID=X0ZJV8_9ZZZZ